MGVERVVAIRLIGLQDLKERLMTEIQFHADLDRPADILVRHAGGNNLEVPPFQEIIWDIKL